MDTWPGLNPDLEHRVWDDAAIASFGLANVQLYSRYIQAELYDGAVDVARIEILHRLGGVYVDADSIALRPIADASFMRAGFFAAWEPPDGRKRAVSGSPPVSNAFIGAEPGHATLATMIERHARVKELKPMWRQTGPGALTEVLAGCREDDVVLLPAWTFFTRSLTGQPVVGGEPFAEHLWSTTAERWGYAGARSYPG